ncbi:flagellin lysine-N-methylase [Cytobacillus massiliigabonensis]|uniref:flagellin lysine-N-methylase n=1 Tax=Cytobacillus massiliigabonensis TaxID=1871011 RepID=UPI000C85E12E|nr:flagellin lysine-N-methylase [Cytobacillus massiliigabonensis]
MKSNTRPILIPEYMKEFQCIGSACEDTCCAGWNVNIDKETFTSYRKVTNPVLKDQLKKNVTRNRSNSSSDNYAKIKMDKGGACTFLDEDHLCKIQKELGQEFLSNTCAIYPRVLNKVDNTVEKSATLSCPEAARLALLNGKGIHFLEEEEPRDTPGFIDGKFSTDKDNVLFWDLRIFSIRIMQDRTTSIENRLIILGLFFQKISSIATHDLKDRLPIIMDEYFSSISNGAFLASVGNIPSNISFQLSVCKSLINFRFSSRVTSKRYIECVKEMLEGLKFNESANLEVVMSSYKDAYENHYMPFIEQHSYILENFLVNYIFKNLFPYDQKNFFDSYVMLIVNFALLKLHLIGIAKYNDKLSTELVIKLIQSFSKTVDHNLQYLTNVQKLLTDNGYTTMAHMVVLLKS